MDLTTVGTYELTATVLEWPDSIEPCDCVPGVQEMLDVCFVVEVYTGVWALHEEPEAQLLGLLTRIGPDVQYTEGLPQYVPFFDFSSSMDPGAGWAFTLLSNIGRDGLYKGYVRDGRLTVSTERASQRTKWYRWEDGNGNPSDCPIPRTLFTYKVVLRATASASGDSYALYGVARASSQATAIATVFPWGDVAQEPQGLHSLDINVVGSAQREPPHYNWLITSSGGFQIGG
ncbi:MAG: hypothetical protein ACPMAQ_09755, partial [Phycisphaerae bacterium]